MGTSSPRSLDTQPVRGEWKSLPAAGAFQPPWAFSGVPVLGDAGNSHQGLWLQFRGCSWEKQSRNHQKKSKGGDRKYGNLARSGEAQAGLAGARVCSEDSLAKAGRSRQSSEGERGGGETRLGLTCGQQHGGGGEARGQVVTALVWRLLREPLGSTCGVTRIFRDKSGQLPPQNHLSSWALSGCFVERAGKASQEGPRERWRTRRNVPGGVRKSITLPLIREEEVWESSPLGLFPKEVRKKKKLQPARNGLRRRGRGPEDLELGS